MPKVVQINPVVSFGSTGRIVEQIGRIAQNRGWESYVAYSARFNNTSTSKLIPVGNRLDASMHALYTRIFDRHGLASASATKKLVNKLIKLKPEIVHLHNIHGYFINYPILVNYLMESNAYTIWTFHDFWPITGHCTYFFDVKCEKWKTQCSHCPKKKLYPKSIVFDNSRQNHHLKREYFSKLKKLTIAPVSKWVSSLVSESFLGKNEILPIYNGVDTDVFFPKKNTEKLKTDLGLQGKFVLLGLATTWGKRKGWDDYFMLSKKIPDDIRIIMVGVDAEQKELLPSNILGIERTENLDKLVELYSMADIVLNISYQETFGLTTAEGLACGTPSIVYNCTASPELIDQQTGIIVEPGDVDGVLSAILTIKNKTKESFRNNCRNRALNLFSMKDRYNDYIDLYEQKTIKP